MVVTFLVKALQITRLEFLPQNGNIVHAVTTWFHKACTSMALRDTLLASPVKYEPGLQKTGDWTLFEVLYVHLAYQLKPSTFIKIQ